MTKRFTSLAHFWLGGSLMLAPAGGLDRDPRAARCWPIRPICCRPWCWAARCCLWTAGFDIIYACQDVDFDRAAGLHSVPARLGVAMSLRLAAACHAACSSCWPLLPLVYPLFGWIYRAAVAAVAVLLVYEHSLVRPDDLTRVNQAFFHVNAVVSLGLLRRGDFGFVMFWRLIRFVNCHDSHEPTFESRFAIRCWPDERLSLKTACSCTSPEVPLGGRGRIGQSGPRAQERAT